MSDPDDEQIREILIDCELTAGEIAVFVTWVIALAALAWAAC